jgi:hypothetical protein
MKKHAINQARVNEKALKRSKGLKGRLKSGKGRPENPEQGIGLEDAGGAPAIDISDLPSLDLGGGDGGGDVGGPGPSVGGDNPADAGGYDWD